MTAEERFVLQGPNNGVHGHHQQGVCSFPTAVQVVGHVSLQREVADTRASASGRDDQTPTTS